MDQASEFPEEWYGLALESHFWFKSRLRFFQAFAKVNGLSLELPLSVIDVGCGEGTFATQLEKVSNWVVDGVDTNEKAIQRARKNRGKISCLDINEMPPEKLGQYDVALLFDVLEHIERPEPFLRSVWNCIAPGGCLVVNVPALKVLYSKYDLAAGHFRRYDRASLAGELEVLNAGTSRIAMRYWGATMVPLLMARKLALYWNRKDVIRFGFSPPGNFANRALERILSFERLFLRNPSFGTSLLAIVRKDEKQQVSQ